MTINSTIRKTNPFVGNGSASTFPFAFKVFTASDVVVVKLQVSTSTETTLALTTDYTVTLNPDQNGNPGGSITLVAGNLATGFNLVITSALEALQGTDLTNQGGFFPEVINDALDKAVILHQQQQEKIDRSIRFSLTNTIGSLEVSESAAERANKVFGFDGNGEFRVAQELGVFKGDWAASTAYVQRDIVRDPVNYNIYICQVAHSSSGAAPLATNGGIANWSLIVDAAAAATSATAAANSATAAATSETNAATSAAAALASQNAAAGSQSAAATSATNAAGSASSSSTDATTATTQATNAAASATAAAASAAQAAAAGAGGAVKISSTDTTTGFMTQKFVAGMDTTLTLKNQGGNETLEISNPYGVAYAIALGG